MSMISIALNHIQINKLGVSFSFTPYWFTNKWSYDVNFLT